MKFTSKPVLLVSSLPLILASFSGCTKANYTPPTSAKQVGATQGTTSASSLDGYWVEESVPAGQTDALGHPLKPSSILIQDGKFFNLVKYSDGTIDKMDAGYTAPKNADSNGNFIIPGSGFVETIAFRGDKLLINDAETQNGVTTKTDYIYLKSDQNTAGQHARQLWFKQKSTYDYAAQYCGTKSNLDPTETAMISKVNQFVDSNLKNNNLSLDQIRVIRNASGGNLNNCQIAEDYLERGIEFAKTGATPLYPELAELPSLFIAVDSKTSLVPLAALQINSLTLMGDSVSTIDLTPLTKMSNLKSLNLQNVKESGFEKLSALLNLEDLALGATELSDDTILKKFPDLMGISMSNSSISIANALDTISSLTQLDSLSLTSTSDISKKIDLSSLGKLKNLTYLSLSNAFFADLKFLPSVEKLTSLDVALENDDDVDMIASLSTITQLNYVSIDKTVKSADDMKFVAKIPHLEALNLTLSSGFKDLSAISNSSTPKLQTLILQGANGEPTQTVPDLTSLGKVSSLIYMELDSLSIPDLKPLESLLNSNPNLSLLMNSDVTTSDQKAEDLVLQKEFGKRYQTTLNFN